MGSTMVDSPMLSIQSSSHHELLPKDFAKRKTFAVQPFKRWRKMMIGCRTYCGPMKPISYFEGLSTPTTAKFGLLKMTELSCKLHCTTRKSRCGVNLSHLPLSGPFSSRKCVILVLKLLAWQVRKVRRYVIESNHP